MISINHGSDLSQNVTSITSCPCIGLSRWHIPHPMGVYAGDNYDVVGVVDSTDPMGHALPGYSFWFTVIDIILPPTHPSLNTHRLLA